MKNWLIVPILGAGVVGGALAMSAFADNTSQSGKRAETFKQLELFADILAKVEADYVTDVDETKAIDREPSEGAAGLCRDFAEDADGDAAAAGGLLLAGGGCASAD